MAKQKGPASGRAKTVSGTAAQNRIAAQRAMAAASGAQAARRKRLLTMMSPVVAVVLIAVVLVVVKVSSGTSSPKSGVKASAAATSVSSEVTGVPLATLNAVGLGSVSTPPTTLTGTALTSGGLPRVLFVGAEWCPYCAAERWGLAVALSRFGSLTGLGQVNSSKTDVYPNTATITFHGASYTSTYVSLTAKEIFSNQVSGGNYETLDTLTSADQSLFTSIGKGSFPFVDIGGKYLISGASYNPGTLQGLTQAQIGADLANPNSAVAKAIDGTANVITAAICKTTANSPSAVCTASGVVAAAAALG